MTPSRTICPSLDQLPERRRASRRGGPAVATLSVELKLVTPVLGGAAVPRTIDEVDVVRVPSIRGQLRFWWRALHAHEYGSPHALWEAESALFGRAADEGGGRSPVEVRVSVEKSGDVDPDDIQLYPKAGKPATPGAYALFPARAETGTGAEAAPRRKPGTCFTLELRGPAERLEKLRNVVRAWILFGGYGSRTRRGLGSLGVHGDDRGEWLPQAATREALAALFGRDVFAPASRAASETPRLAGATLLVGRTLSQKELGIQTPMLSDAEPAWLTALHWLRDFRQSPNEGARSKKTIVDPKSNKTKQLPGVSNWPEADVIRRLVRDKWTHEPRAEHRGIVRWPRAEFGLPIGFQFLGEGPRDDDTKKPVRFDLVWKDPSARGDEERERLASALIVKAMPLADGEFVPIALWLDRAFPKGGVVVLRRGGKEEQGSQVPFDKLLGRGDKTLFAPLAGKTSLRQSFLDWLVDTGRARRIAG